MARDDDGDEEEDAVPLLAPEAAAPAAGAAGEAGPRPTLAHRARVAATIACWFALNIAIGNLNGWVLKRRGFGYPVALTAVHMLCCRALAGLCLRGAVEPLSALALRKVRTMSVAFCASVACGNIALRFIYVSFAQMVTAAGPLFTMALMYTMAGKRYSLAAYASMLPMCGGVMMCTAGEINFNATGFAAVVGATLLRGVKSILQQRLLTEPDERFDSLTLLYHMSGCSIAPLAAYAALVEHAALRDPKLAGEGAASLWALVLASGLVAFFLNLANFTVTKLTSAVALQVLGNVKVVLSIALSLAIFGNRVSEWSAAGCAVTLLGVAAYNRAPKAG